jgi:hypothetical protein
MPHESGSSSSQFISLGVTSNSFPSTRISLKFSSDKILVCEFLLSRMRDTNISPFPSSLQFMMNETYMYIIWSSMLSISLTLHLLCTPAISERMNTRTSFCLFKCIPQYVIFTVSAAHYSMYYSLRTVYIYYPCFLSRLNQIFHVIRATLKSIEINL